MNESILNFDYEGISYENHTVLEYAVRLKDISLLKACIQAGADINNGIYKPLLIAAKNLANPDQEGCATDDVNVEILKILLSDELLADNRVNINIGNEFGGNALNYAAKKGRVDVVAFLLQQGVSINLCSNYGLPPIFTAVLRGHHRVVDLLCQSGADLTPKIFNSVDDDEEELICDMDLLVIAIEKNHIDTILVLLHYIKNPSNLCWGHIYKTKDHGTLKLFLENGIDPNTMITILGEDGFSTEFTLIQSACANGSHEMIKVLLSLGADPNLYSRDGYTTLYLATISNQVESIKILLDSGKIKDIHQANHGEENNTTLYIAKFLRHAEIVELLIAHGKRLQNASTPISSNLSSLPESQQEPEKIEKTKTAQNSRFGYSIYSEIPEDPRIQRKRSIILSKHPLSETQQDRIIAKISK